MVPRKCNLVDQYLAILLLVFAEAGLADVRCSRTTTVPDCVLTPVTSAGFGDLGDRSAGRRDCIQSFPFDCYRLQSCRAGIAAGACYSATSKDRSLETRSFSNRR